MESGVKGVASAIGTLAVGMGKLGTISLSFAGHIMCCITCTFTAGDQGAKRVSRGKAGNLFQTVQKTCDCIVGYELGYPAT